MLSVFDGTKETKQTFSPIQSTEVEIRGRDYIISTKL